MFKKVSVTDIEFRSATITPLRILSSGRRKVHDLGCPMRDIKSPSHPTDTDSLSRLKDMRLGGEYWNGTAPIDNHQGYSFVVAIASNDSDGVALWEAVCKERHDERGLLILETGVDTCPFIRAGIPYLHHINPHPLLDSKPDVFSDVLGMLAQLGAIYRCRVLTSRNGSDFRIVRPEVLAFWLLNGVEWRSPFDGCAISFDAALDIVADAKRSWEKLSRVGGFWGVSWWKRNTLNRFIDFPDCPPCMSGNSRKVLTHAKATGKAIAIWVSRPPGKLDRTRARTAGVPLYQVEDGFIRSSGLGSDLFPPHSIVIDKQGIYFDASRESDLEHILNTSVFDARILARARSLIDMMIEGQVTKYNVNDTSLSKIDFPTRKTRILVPGQVADDLSVKRGSPVVTGNLSLLEVVREKNPDAFIVFRPHPDVDAGHRTGHIPDTTALQHADYVARGGSILTFLSEIDEVHTMTSLTGFEALIRNKKVVTYGMPFYAGWGLTSDLLQTSRRNRRLTVEELVAGALLLYPFYLDPVTKLLCGPEILIARLHDPSLWRPGRGTRIRRLQGKIRRKLTKTLIKIGRQFS